MKKLTIDRSVLLTPAEQKRRGLETGELCTSDGKKMCCLGIILHDAGVRKADLIGHNMPVGLPNSNSVLIPEWMKSHQTKSNSMVLSHINDNPKLHWRERERLLTEKFAETGIGIEVTFVGRYT